MDDGELEAFVADFAKQAFAQGEPASAHRTFRIREPGHECKVTVDEAAVSLERPHEKKVVIARKDLEHLYVDPIGDALWVIMLGHRDGRRRRIERIDAEMSESASDLVETLTREHPGIDLRALGKAKAFARMGARDTNRIALIIIGALLFLGAIALSFSSISRILHYQPVTVDAGATIPDDATYVVVRHARPMTQAAWAQTDRRYNQKTDVYVPLVPEKLDCAPAHVALHLSPGAETDPAFTEAREFSGGRELDDIDQRLVDSAPQLLPHGSCVNRFEAPLVVLSPSLSRASDLAHVGLWLLAAAALTAVVAWAMRRQRASHLGATPQAGPYR